MKRRVGKRIGPRSGSNKKMDILHLAEQQLRKAGIDATVAYLKSSKAKKEKKLISLVDLLCRLARRIQARDPKLALTVVERAVEEDENCMPAVTLSTSLYDRLGERKRAREAGLVVVNSEYSTPQEILQTANLLVRLGKDELALSAGKEAFEKLGRPLGWVGNIQYIAQRTSAWWFLKELVEQIETAYDENKDGELNESPRTHLLWCDDEQRNINVISAWAARSLPIPKGVKPAPVPKKIDGRKIKVGYLSSDFREHPTSRLVNGLLRHHNHKQFEIHLYCSGWDDGSEMRKEIESHADQIHPVAELSDEDAAALIRSHEIDILVELNGPTRANRMGVLTYRPAPVQIDYLGWPGSVGGRIVDYIIGDFYTVPAGAEALYPEKVIRIKDTYQVNDYAARELPPAPDRKKLNLPENVPVIGMLNAINKVNHEVWTVWLQILKEVPDAVIWILDPGVAARKNISKFTRKMGVSPKRIIAAPSVSQEAHLARLQCCDIMVDPWPYGGHTSTADALFAGVPVIALEGTNFPSRVSGGLLKAAGLDDLVQTNVDSYVKVASELLKNPDEIARIKAFMKKNVMSSSVFDAASRAREMEAAYMVALGLVAQGKPPMHINIGKPPAIMAPKVAVLAPQKVKPAAPKKPPAPSFLDEDKKVPLVLVCGPWSSGTSAVAGMLANAGLWAPGPYVKVNDPRTSQTYEMRPFRDMLRELISEETLKRKKNSTAITEELAAFRDGSLSWARAEDGVADNHPVLLKHALPALLLPEMSKVFDISMIVVLRPLNKIENTRIRRNWMESFGKKGAKTVYQQIFNYALSSDVPSRFVRYTELLQNPRPILDDLVTFCGIDATENSRKKALKFLKRP